VFEYTYDIDQRLVKRTIDADGAGAGTATAEHFVYDDNQIIFTFTEDVAGGELDNWGPQVDQLLAHDAVAANGTSTTTWALNDHLGSVRDLVQYDATLDATSVVGHYVYDAFGQVTSHTGAVTSVIQFTGRYRDAATALQWNLNRWYDFATGKWISEDPIGFSAEDANLVRYVGNKPKTETDPDGLDYIRDDEYFMYGPIPMRHLYLVVTVWGYKCNEVYIGMEDPTGVVYRPYTEGPDCIGARGDWRNWYKGLEKKSYSLSRAKVESKAFWSWKTQNWYDWFKEHDNALTKLDTAAREATLAGTFKHSADFFNRLTIFVGDVKWTIAEGAVLQASYAFSFFRAAGTACKAGVTVTVKDQSKTVAKYYWNPKTAQYHNSATGKFVSPKDIPWPSNGGFVNAQRTTIKPGVILDRYGKASGRFLGKPGWTISQRGMAPGSEAMKYTRYRVMKPIDVKAGTAAAVPEFNATGGAMQFQHWGGKSVQWLIDNGYLKELLP
jgi:RHS repeat-associated protein